MYCTHRQVCAVKWTSALGEDMLGIISCMKLYEIARMSEVEFFQR